MEEEYIPEGVYICTCDHWGFNILDGEICCLGCKTKYPLKRFKSLNGTISYILKKPKIFNKKIRKEAQDSRIKPERMDHVEIGPSFRKPKNKEA